MLSFTHADDVRPILCDPAVEGTGVVYLPKARLRVDGGARERPNDAILDDLKRLSPGFVCF